MKAVVNDKNHLTFVSHLNGVTIIESSGFIIDLDYQCLASICEIADLGNTCTIKDCDEIESLKSNNNELTERIKFLEEQLINSDNRITELRNQINGLTNEVDIRGQRISQLNNEIETLKADNCKENEQYNELYNRNEYLEKKLAISRDNVTVLEETNAQLKETIANKNNSIKHLNKVIEEKTNSLVKLENIEDTLNTTVKVNEELNIQLSCAKEDIDKLNEQLEEKTSLLAERTHALRVFRRALYDMRLYVQPYKEYKLDFEWLTIHNSIDSSFFIRFKNTASAARAIGDCRYYISLKDVLDKYENDIADFNVSAMDIYYIHKASPNVVRKFNYDNFNITCKDQHTANTINTLLNCSNISVYDIVEKFKDEIAHSNVY